MNNKKHICNPTKTNYKECIKKYNNANIKKNHIIITDKEPIVKQIITPIVNLGCI